MRNVTGAVLCATALLGAALGSSAAARGPSAYVSGVLPVPYAKGTNSDLEPSLASGPDGRLLAASNYLRPPCGGTVGACGTDVWTSRDHGRSWRWIGNPFAGATNDGGFGGFDTDVAIAPERNPQDRYNLYVASLWNVSNGLAVSHDDGATWSLLPVAGAPGALVKPPVALPASAPVTVVPDRPWLAADGPCTVYLAYNVQPGNTTVMHQYDGCQQVPVASSASLPFVPVDADAARTEDKVSGRPAIDVSPSSPYRHRLYYPAVYTSAPMTVEVSVSPDGGRTWGLHRVATMPRYSRTAVWPVTAAVDRAGAVYVAWHDGETAWLSVSRDGGSTWTSPKVLNRPGTTAVYATVAAGRAGDVAVAWYGTNRSGPSYAKDRMGAPFAKGSAVWDFVVVRSHDGGRTFGAPAVARHAVHRGMVCIDGGGCTEPGSRALLDCYGASLDLQGRFAAVFTESLPRRSITVSGSHSDFVADR